MKERKTYQQQYEELAHDFKSALLPLIRLVNVALEKIVRVMR